MMKIFYVVKSFDRGYLHKLQLPALRKSFAPMLPPSFTKSLLRAYRFDDYANAEYAIEKLPKGFYKIEKIFSHE